MKVDMVGEGREGRLGFGEMISVRGGWEKEVRVLKREWVG